MSNSTKKIGLANVSPERRAQIAAMGGRKAHATGKAHRFTSEEAAQAGRKGGHAVSRDREHMAKIGRVGGSRRHQRPELGSNQQPSA